MYVKWGDFRFEYAGCELVIDRQPQLDAAQNPIGFEEVWRMRYLLPNPTGNQGVMTSKLRELEQAFSRGGKDLRLLLSDGSSDSNHVLLSKNTQGGTRVTKPPSYPEGKGYQYGTFRTVDIEVTAFIPVAANSRSALASFVETLSYQGGGPRYGHLEPVVGLPIKQKLKQATVWRARQQGVMIGLYSYPTTIPLPIWPDALIESQGVEIGPVGRVGNTLMNFQVQWTYNFEAALPRTGRPHVWTN